MNRAKRLWVGLGLVVLFAAMAASCSKCGQGKKADEGAPQVEGGSTASRPSQPGLAAPPPETQSPQAGTGKVLSAEEFYNLMFDRQEVSLKFQEKRLALFKKHGSFNDAMRQDLVAVNNEVAQAHREILDKYGINYIDLRETMQNKELQAANSEYLRTNPQVQEKLKANRERQMKLSEELRPYEEKARAEMQQQAPAAAPPPAPPTAPAK